VSKMKVVIDCDKCKLSGECIKVCPQKAIFVKNGKAVIDCEKCNLDGICIPACPENAIKFIEDE
jgi:NAD-dependent dihydropyrimidine dehydrogenase PreA subunit